MPVKSGLDLVQAANL